MVSIVLGVLIYGKPGTIGQNLIPQLEYAIGWIEYLIPIAIFAAAVNLACEQDKRTITIKLLQYLSLVIAIAVIITVLGGNTGIAGTTFTIWLTGMFGKLSTVVISAGVIVILSIFMYGIKPAEKVKEIVEERKERNIEKREAREKVRTKKENTIVDNEDDEVVEPKISGIKNSVEKLKEKQRSKKELRELESKEAEVLDNQINIKMASENGLFKKQEETKEDKSKEDRYRKKCLSLIKDMELFFNTQFLSDPQESLSKKNQYIDSLLRPLIGIMVNSNFFYYIPHTTEALGYKCYWNQVNMIEKNIEILFKDEDKDEYKNVYELWQEIMEPFRRIIGDGDSDDSYLGGDFPGITSNLWLEANPAIGYFDF